jgi:putative ABC transport system permease protein
MLIRDFSHLSISAFLAYRLRSFLTALGIAVGIAAVVLLTSIGEGVHQYVLAEFAQFGTNIIGINPGRATTHGVSIGMFGSVQPLTIEDSEALRRVPYTVAVAVVPAVQGNAEVEANGRSRRTTVYGVGPDFPAGFHLNVASGRFLPADDPTSARAFAVLGSTVRQALFPFSNPLGKVMRISGERYRIIGSMASKGQVLGIDMDDSVYIPASRSLSLFNRDGLMEVDVIYREGAPVDEVVASIKRILMARHGRDDFTITTQQQMMDVLGSVLDVLTFAVAALGGVSLLVGSVGIFTIMTIAVTERTSEIGVFRALGATRQQILGLFLGEAMVLAALGGVAGLIIGVGGAQLLHLLVPALPVHMPWLYVALAEVLAVVIGLLAGVLPALRAAHFDPIEALREE